jgi:hypothetical protein
MSAPSWSRGVLVRGCRASIQNHCFRLLLRPMRVFFTAFLGTARPSRRGAGRTELFVSRRDGAASRGCVISTTGWPTGGRRVRGCNGQALGLTLDLLPFLRPRSRVPCFFGSSNCAPPPVSSPRPSRRVRPVLDSPPRLGGPRRPQQRSAPRRAAATRALLRS